MTNDVPKRRGRPPIAEEDRKNTNLTFRTRGGLRTKLDEAAQDSGRSISEEIEYRLQQSFDRRSIAYQMFGEDNIRLIESINTVLNSANWLGDEGDSAPYLAAISILLAYAEMEYKTLIERNTNPATWLALSQLGIARACKVKVDTAKDRALRAIPEMAEKLAKHTGSVNDLSIED